MSGISLRAAQLEVLSRALAHLAHDVQNHLAIINESAGWMKDLMDFKSKQSFGRVKSFLYSSKRRAQLEPYFSHIDAIDKQVNEASALTRHLSSFAYRIKERRSVFNVNMALEDIGGFLLRQAEDNGMRLELKLSGGEPMIETDPSGFQMAVFENAVRVMEGMESGDCLTLESVVSGDQFHVSLTGPYNGPLVEDSDKHDNHWYIIDKLNGKIQIQFIDRKCVITLVFTQTSGEA